MAARLKCKAKSAQEMALADAWWPGEDHVAMLADKRSVEMLDELRFWKFGLKREVKRLERFKCREFRGSDPRPVSVFRTLRYFECNECLEIGQRLGIFAKTSLIIRKFYRY